jgi:hypothetical protein
MYDAVDCQHAMIKAAADKGALTNGRSCSNRFYPSAARMGTSLSPTRRLTLLAGRAVRKKRLTSCRSFWASCPDGSAGNCSGLDDC